MICSVMWLAISSRPDIAYTIPKLYKFMSRSLSMHMTPEKRLLPYVKSIKNCGNVYKVLTSIC